MSDPMSSTPPASDQVSSPPGQPLLQETSEAPRELRKGPLSFLSGALTSGLLAWLSLNLSRRVLAYYGAHPPHYSTQVAQSIATAVKTLVVGMTFLATFSFAFVGLGLLLTFLRSLGSLFPDREPPEPWRPS